MILNPSQLFLFLIGITFVFSCGQDNSDAEITVNNNVTTTVSKDTSKLNKLLNLRIYKPDSVQFKYVFQDNSGQNTRLSIPGPSDYSLQALLYFDSITFKKIIEKFDSIEYQPLNLKKEYFSFDWLNSAILNELNSSDTSYHGHPNLIFQPDEADKLWLLKNKILAAGSSN